MSTWLYGSLTRSQDDRTSTDTNKYVEILAALVPAEVLAIHALVMSQTSELGLDPSKKDLLTIFWVLIALCLALYFWTSRENTLENLLRGLIPPAAFTAWAMLQSPSAFDGLEWDIGPIMRLFIPLVLAVLVSAVIAPPARFRRKPQPAGGVTPQNQGSSTEEQAQQSDHKDG